MLILIFNQHVVPRQVPLRPTEELLDILRREDEEILTLIPAMWKVIHGAITR